MKEVTKANATNGQMGDIQTIMEVSGLTEEEAFKVYNESMQIPFDPEPFKDDIDEWED